MRRTVPPSAEIEHRIDELLADGIPAEADAQGTLSELAGLGAKLIIQRAVEEEFEGQGCVSCPEPVTSTETARRSRFREQPARLVTEGESGLGPSEEDRSDIKGRKAGLITRELARGEV